MFNVVVSDNVELVQGIHFDPIIKEAIKIKQDGIIKVVPWDYSAVASHISIEALIQDLDKDEYFDNTEMKEAPVQ